MFLQFNTIIQKLNELMSNEILYLSLNRVLRDFLFIDNVNVH